MNKIGAVIVHLGSEFLCVGAQWRQEPHTSEDERAQKAYSRKNSTENFSEEEHCYTFWGGGSEPSSVPFISDFLFLIQTSFCMTYGVIRKKYASEIIAMDLSGW